MQAEKNISLVPENAIVAHHETMLVANTMHVSLLDSIYK